MNLATNIPLFHSLNALPIKLDPKRLDEGGGINETLRQKKAKYHESCRLLFNNTKLHRAEKRSTPTGTSDEGGRCRRCHSTRTEISPCLLVALYNPRTSLPKVQEQEKAQEHWKEAYPIAFSELVTYISEMKNASDSSDPLILKLANLTMLYKQRLEQLGVESPDVHPTRLKDQLLFHIPKLQAHRQGRDVMLALKNDVGSILSQASKYGEAIHLAKAAGI
ncbi:hypothetical protein OS493_033327 [Desmophyllum pertusum]|uniref:Uncharacterized protein n=1 Tax=Desmophyllum pertusum TaxID=174260 RepID=A0A9W9ZAX0_9CNID|nr:hypothetical protein OS493_033327 [Desmophyllum pertusum]